MADYKAEQQLISLPNGNGNGFLAHTWFHAIQEVFAKTIRNEDVEKGIEIGVGIGVWKGEDRVNKLNSHLISDKRFDDLTRATNDKQYQAKLYKEYGL